MRTLAVSISLLALAITAGCAQMRSGSAMGAGPAATVMCRDGAWVSSASECGVHGGVERTMASPSQK